MTPPALVKAIDVSSWQPTDLSALIADHQVGHVVVRLYLEAELPSQNITRAQIASAKANGYSVGCYMWLYANADPAASVREAVALARDAGVEPPVLWLDIEPYTDGTMPDATQLRAAIAECRRLGVRPGIYSGIWCYDRVGAGTEFSDVPLWTAEYDGDPNPDVFTPYSGWQRCAAKQWAHQPLDLDTFRYEYTVIDASSPP